MSDGDSRATRPARTVWADSGLTDVPRSIIADPSVVMDWASSRDDLRRIRLEVERRAWAVASGIPTAEVIAVDPEWRWLASRQVPDEPGETMAYVEAALDASRRIQAAPRPEPGGTSTRRPARPLAPVRLVRMAAAGIDVMAFAEARRAAAALPRETTVHNDFHRGNVLNPGHQGRGVVVIDWELLDSGPSQLDMVQLVVDLASSETAVAAWQLLLSQTSPRRHRSLAVLLRWLAIRTYASDVCGPRDDRDADKLRRRRARLREVETWLS